MECQFSRPLPLGSVRFNEILESLDDKKNTVFAREVIPRIATVVGESASVLKTVRVLKSTPAGDTLCLTRLQALTLLCNAFFGLLQEQTGSFPPVPTFKALLHGKHPLWPFWEHYFAVETLDLTQSAKEEIVVSRLCMQERPDLLLSNKKMCRVVVTIGETMEAADDCDSLVNFANANLSGHLFEGAIAQEEILFSMRPELAVTAILCERLRDNEVVCVSGTRWFCAARGYGRKVVCEPFAQSKRDAKTILCMDAQYGCLGKSKAEIDRDMFKGLCAFSGPGVQSVSTGRWGAGMFAKHPELTFLQQVIAASEAELKLLKYACFDQEAEGKAFSAFLKMCDEMQPTVGSLCAALLASANRVNRSAQKLLDFIAAELRK